VDYLPPARAIMLTGFMGTGKSTNGRRLARRLGLDFLDTDDLVEEAAGKTIRAIFEEEGEQAFRDLETEALGRSLAGPRSVIATGGGIMLRAENVAMMKAGGPVICLQASPKTILSRTSCRDTRPLLQGEDPLGTIKTLMDERRDAYGLADYAVSADNADRGTVLERMCEHLAGDPRTAVLVEASQRVMVRAGSAQYRIHIQRGAFHALDKLCPARSKEARCLIVTTKPIAELYADLVTASLAAGGWDPDVIALADGEATKTLDGAAALYDRLIDRRVDSAGMVFALGGGVVGDLAGFVAATYRRGIAFAQLPTSLLAQVDASSGGKVAVNHPRGKNLIGTFHQPAGVVIDTATLDTLPERELRSGLAEIIKHAAIADADMFGFLESELEAFLALDEVAVRYILARNCQIKARFVEQDPWDRGQRAVLNYGHTIGHAVERCAGEWDLRHGEAVAIGMVAEARLAHKIGICDESTVARQLALIEKAGLPTTAPPIDMTEAAESLMLDKKISGGRLRLPLVPAIGQVKVLTDIEPDALREALMYVAHE